MAQRFDRTVIELVETAARAYKTAPLILGGTGGEGGGVGIPPGGVVGQLAQYRVAYDTTEAATLATLPSGVAGISGWSLVDNLNHIRYRLNTLESGGAGTFTLVDDNTSTTYSDVSTLHVSGGVLVTDLGGGSISLEVTASGVGGGGQPIASYYQDGSHDSITDSTDGNQLSIDTEYIDLSSIAHLDGSNNVVVDSDGWYSIRAIIGIHGTSAFNGKTTAYVNDAYTTKTYETAENITNDIFEVGPFILEVTGGSETISIYIDNHLGENISAWVYELSVEPNNVSGGGGSLDGTYLRLDTTNNPLTDSLEIINDNDGNAGIYIQTTGDAFTADFEQYTVNNNVSSPALFLYQETSGSGTVYGEAIEAWRSDTGAGTIVANWLTFHNADTSNDDFIVDKDGHAYDNGQRLITDAPSDGKVYGRKNAAWVDAWSGAYLEHGVTINDAGGDFDTRIESDTESNMLLVDASADKIYFGGITNGIEIEKGGKFKAIGTATWFDDVRVEPTVRGSGSKAPVYTNYAAGGGASGIYFYLFDNAIVANEKEVNFKLQMPHGKLLGSAIHLHIHWVPTSTGSAGDKVRWGLEYTKANPNGTFGTTNTIYATDPIDPPSTTPTAHTHYLTEFADIDMTGDALSTILLCRLFRNSSNAADTFSGDVGLLYIDAHIEFSQLGSNDEYSQ